MSARGQGDRTPLLLQLPEMGSIILCIGKRRRRLLCRRREEETGIMEKCIMYTRGDIAFIFIAGRRRR